MSGRAAGQKTDFCTFCPDFGHFWQFFGRPKAQKSLDAVRMTGVYRPEPYGHFQGSWRISWHPNSWANIIAEAGSGMTSARYGPVLRRLRRFVRASDVVMALASPSRTSHS